ncbi:leucine-rich_repeat domain-containing protein [Hexamita inflata]|uniref:Leucine-rich repeat domain-containing protein n=1 Tax=Hexamita inflata TaxID=28002 RepID=A0AA86R0N6_9EUKA|nr:leucine-rich repeat domain-containing protein [Hexamita inflata]
MAKTQVVDLHPLQYLYKLESIYAYDACIIDVSPLSKLTQLKDLDFRKNKITNAETLKHHKNFSEYSLSHQDVPTTDDSSYTAKYSLFTVPRSKSSKYKLRTEPQSSKSQQLTSKNKSTIKQTNKSVL